MARFDLQSYAGGQFFSTLAFGREPGEQQKKGTRASLPALVNPGFLEDTRRILEQVHEATTRAKRLARGQTGTLRVGFVESISWHGAWVLLPSNAGAPLIFWWIS
jgi:hypothetical protein